ncbi:MAG: hypothetical protein WC827_03695 [Candidatus Paceibacterota bacterium]|jgi:hypothetical protein
MNKQDRKEVEEIINILTDVQSRIESLGEAEQEKFDNLSEGLQQAERGQKMEEDASTISDIASDLNGIIEALQELS